MNSLTDILQELCLDYKQGCIPFKSFETSILQKTFSITAYDSSGRVLYNGLCNVILHAT